MVVDRKGVYLALLVLIATFLFIQMATDLYTISNVKPNNISDNISDVPMQNSTRTNTVYLNVFHQNSCWSLPPFEEYATSVGGLDFERILSADPLANEDFLYAVEPYVSCIPWAEPPVKISYSRREMIASGECEQYPQIFSGKVHDEGDEMFIIDLFAFGYEMDVLEIRVNMLYHLVDHFVLNEDIYSQRIMKKPLFFERSKHARFASLDPENKIIHFIKDDAHYNLYHQYFVNATKRTHFYDTSQTNNARKMDWRNENAFRTDAFLKYLDLLFHSNLSHFLLQHPNALLLISDLDEVPDPDKLKLLKYCQIRSELVDAFWNNSQARVNESSYGYYSHNFNIQSPHGGIRSFLFRVDERLHARFVAKDLNFGRNAVAHRSINWFTYLERIEYRGWHMARLRTPYEYYFKGVCMAEGGSWDWLTNLCDRERFANWSFTNLWSEHAVIDLDYYHSHWFSNAYDQALCTKELLLNPYAFKVFFDNALFPNLIRVRFSHIYDMDAVYELPQYVKLNRDRYPFYFPKFCALLSPRTNNYQYRCDWTGFDEYYDARRSCWLKLKNDRLAC